MPRKITLAEALQLSQEILLKAEQARLDFAEWEAARGIQYGD